MSTDLNSHLLVGKNTKIRKVTSIRKFIIDKINENQNIRRYLRYTTSLPLAKQSTDYDGTMVKQPNLVENLYIDSIEGEQCLFSGSFNPEMSNIKIPYIFVHSYKTRVKNSDGLMMFAIHILCSEKYNNLKNYGDERIYKIAEEIIEMLDDYSIQDKQIVDITGNVKFTFDGDFDEYRLSKSSDIVVLTIPIVIRNIALRSK